MEDVKELINVKDSVYSKFIFMFGFEVFGKGNRAIEIKLVDCRKDRQVKLSQFLKKETIIKSKSDHFKDNNTVPT